MVSDESVRVWFFQELDRLDGNVTAAARVVGVPAHRARSWARAVGIHGRGKPGKAPHPGRDEYFRLRDQGHTQAAAAARVGIHPRTGRDWESGARRVNGVRIYPSRPVQRYNSGMQTCAPSLAAIEKRLHPRFLTLQEREQIADLRREGASYRAIGRVLGRAASTVKREIDTYAEHGVYRPYAAQRAWARSRARPKPAKLATRPRLREFVQHKLRLRWSPEQISRALVREFPNDEEMRVSAETIYQALYVQARGGLKREIAAALRSGRTARKPQRRAGQRTPRFPGTMVMISERPPEVEDRAVPGHWEGDLLLGARNESAIVTLVERATRFVLLGHVPGAHTAEAVRDVLVELIGGLPEQLRRSVTWDQGSEMAAHHQFTVATNVPVYFCDPHSPWQRGSNENTNGLLRQYFPKGTDLAVHTRADLERVAWELNGRPRKTLDWDTPAQRLHALLATT